MSELPYHLDRTVVIKTSPELFFHFSPSAVASRRARLCNHPTLEGKGCIPDPAEALGEV